ncbi:MAG: hypothetical protein AB7I12_12535 [Steroidobacteraceae bacterium]
MPDPPFCSGLDTAPHQAVAIETLDAGMHAGLQPDSGNVGLKPNLQNADEWRRIKRLQPPVLTRYRPSALTTALARSLLR